MNTYIDTFYIYKRIRCRKLISPQKHVYVYRYILDLQKDKVAHEI